MTVRWHGETSLFLQYERLLWECLQMMVSPSLFLLCSSSLFLFFLFLYSSNSCIINANKGKEKEEEIQKDRINR